MGDALQVSHERFNSKMVQYSQLRPVYAFSSMRQKRVQLLKNGIHHKKFISKAVRNIAKYSLAANKTTGRYVLKYVKEKILLHGWLVRNHGLHFRCDHIYTNLKKKSDIHPASRMKRSWRKQKSMMKMLGAEIESHALMLFLEQKLVDGEVIQEDDQIPGDSPLLALSESTEAALDELRMLKLA